MLFSETSRINLNCFFQCTNDELIAEEKHRRDVLVKERGRRRSVFLRICMVASLLFLVAVLWAWFHGSPDLVSFISGGAGIRLEIGNFRAMEKPSRFEARQIAALQEINMILRERGLGSA